MNSVSPYHPTLRHPTRMFIHSFILIGSKMASDMLLPIILSELVDSDNERPRRGKTREWIRLRSQLGLYETLIKELIIEDRLSFKEMFRMSVEDFEAVLSQIHDLIAPQEFQGGPRPISSDERLVLAIRYVATGESFHSLSFQFRISRKLFRMIFIRFFIREFELTFD